jgi:hypothetical protein
MIYVTEQRRGAVIALDSWKIGDRRQWEQPGAGR